MAAGTKGRTRVERGIYRQSNGKFAVCARRAREELIAALEAGRVPASPRLRLDTVAGRWSERFEAMVAAGERHRRPTRRTASTSTTTFCPGSGTSGSDRSGSRTSPI